LKLGKHPARRDPRTLKLARFLSETAPAAPDVLDWFSGIEDFGMMANDKRGNCTIAGLAHGLQTQSAATGSEYTVSDAVVMDAYARWCGFDPSKDQEDGFNPTDRGGVELDVLKQFRRDGLGGKSLLAFTSVAVSNFEHIKRAIHMLGGLYIGLQLPLTAQDQDTWDVVINSNENQVGSWGGHAVWVPAFDARRSDHETLDCLTWGKRKRMTLDFFRTYCDEVWALLMGDWASFGSSDFKLGNLQAELATVTA
jgi:hypothetical protein